MLRPRRSCALRLVAACLLLLAELPAVVGQQPPALASGGTYTYARGYEVFTFTSSGTFTPTCASCTHYVLVVAGGGGGGGGNYMRTAGGGGGGGVLTTSFIGTNPASYAVTVGAGGAGGSAGTGGSGGNSAFGSLATAVGGGGGASGVSGGGSAGSGGSGGGAPHGNNLFGTGTTGQGYSGGGKGMDSGSATGAFSGSGGGGATVGGQAGYCTGGVSSACASGTTLAYGGAGGAGYTWSYTGQTYGGGGGGSAQECRSALYTYGGAGGAGGGGAGAVDTNCNSAPNGNAATSYGGGGGGAAGNISTVATGGNGYQGVVIVAFVIPSPPPSPPPLPPAPSPPPQPPPPNLYSFAGINFTSCNATGRLGPSNATCQSYYGNTPWIGFYSVVSSWQSWEVPFDAVYTITAAGASGHGGLSSTTSRGAVITTVIHLSYGTTLLFMVGQMGQNSSGTNGIVGGGGCVVRTLRLDTRLLGAGALAALTIARRPTLAQTTVAARS